MGMLQATSEKKDRQHPGKQPKCISFCGNVVSGKKQFLVKWYHMVNN
jgi:hypothetical protein